VTIWSDRRYVVVDVEGNGHQPPDPVELGMVSIEAGVIGQPVSWLFRPDQPINTMAQRIHGISNEMVADAPRFASLAGDLRACLTDVVLVAHNAGIDLGVLRRKLPDFAPAEVLDTLKLSRRWLADQPSHRLGVLVTALHLGVDIPAGLRPHRAAYDVLVTARLLVYLATHGAGAPQSFEVLRDGPGGTDATLF
jgi:exodeoxyribonuclease X